MSTLFPDEKILTESDNKTVTLTTHRVLYEYKEWGRSYNQNIMLEHITSTENYSKSNIILPILAVAALAVAIALFDHGDTQEGFISIGAAVVLYWLYGKTRKSWIVVSSPSTRMTIDVRSMKTDAVLSFINKVEQAKNKRLLELKPQFINN